MGSDNRMRGSSDGMLEDGVQPGHDRQGVGGRQGQAAHPAGGGGSPDNCTFFEIPLSAKKNRVDPRLQELHDMGMRPRWIHIAEQIGIDAFLTLWRLLDENPPNMPGTTVYVSMPRFTRYLRYQRNRFIEDLVSSGTPSQDIKKRIRQDLCEDVTVRHIDRITAKLRKNAKMQP